MGSLGTRSLTLLAPRSTTRICIVCCVVGDGEAETGPLAASWHSNKFLNPARDGAVMPILHLNGYKIANPTVLARIPRRGVRRAVRRLWLRPRFVAGDDPAPCTRLMAATLDRARRDPRDPEQARSDGQARLRPRWPMIVLRSPKGWTGPKVVDGKQAEGTWRSHQVPLADVRRQPGAPGAARRMAAQLPARRAVRRDRRPIGDTHSPRAGGRPAHGRQSARQWRPAAARSGLPDFRDYAVEVPTPGATTAEADTRARRFLRDVMKRNPHDDFRLFGPDETASNRLEAVFEATDRDSMARCCPTDEHLAPTAASWRC